MIETLPLSLVQGFHGMCLLSTNIVLIAQQVSRDSTPSPGQELPDLPIIIKRTRVVTLTDL